jgi:hypothetical protein
MLSVPARASAPSLCTLKIVEGKPVQPFMQLEYAIGMVETYGDTLAYNPLEEAYGIFQIRSVRLDDYNKRTNHNYKPSDLFSFRISEEIFLYYAAQIGPYNLEKIARRWNGCGQLTDSYWTRVRHLL